MSFLTVLSVIFLADDSSSTSLSQRDTSETVGWTPDPSGRGTFTLLTSCILTLGICVWSAMHLNIPPQGEGPFRYWFRNIRWGLTGIFGPELVVFIAWKQYLSARAVVQKSRYVPPIGDQRLRRGQPTKSGSSEEVVGRDTTLPYYQPVSWTMVHGFYAGMGGFVIPLNTGAATPGFTLQDDCHELTLTAHGVALLAECGILPNICVEDIVDKSKSDGLAKLLACTQAAWFAIQIIGRLALGLRVTLLEVNTLGHVLCALVIYVLWWHKPRLVQEPTRLEGDWAWSVAAYMYMSSRMSRGAIGEAGECVPSSTEPELSSVALFERVPHPCSHESIQGCHRTSADEKDTTVVDERDGSMECFFGPKPVQHETTKSERTNLDYTSVSNDSDDFKDRRTLRWRLAAEAVCRFPAIRRRFQSIGPLENATDTRTGTRCLRELHPYELVTEYSGNWFTDGLLPGVASLVMGTALWFMSVAFGAIHAAAWYGYFPTLVEAWMWRSSAIYIMFSGFLWSMINLSAKLSKSFDDRWERMRRPSAPWVNSPILAIICGCCGTAYAFARIFLVVEAFISLRQLPKGAYQTPEWTQLIPHL